MVTFWMLILGLYVTGVLFALYKEIMNAPEDAWIKERVPNGKVFSPRGCMIIFTRVIFSWYDVYVLWRLSSKIAVDTKA